MIALTILTLPLLTAVFKRLRREAFGDQVKEDIISQQDLDAVYDIASYSLSGEVFQETLGSLE